MKQSLSLLLLSCFLNPASASIVYTNEIDLGGDDSGSSYNYQFDNRPEATVPAEVILTSRQRYLGYRLVEDVELRSLDNNTTEGAVGVGEDLRIDFLYGAKDQVSIGYLVDDFISEVSVFDENDNLLTTQTFSRAPVYDVVNPGFEHGAGPEFYDGYDGQLDIPFSGTAAYMTFDFDINQESSNSEFRVDNLQMNAAQNQVLDRYQGAMVEYAAKSKISSPQKQVFDLTVTQNGIGGIAPIFINSGMLGDYQIDISGSAQFMSIAVINELFQSHTYSAYNLNINGVGNFDGAFSESIYVYPSFDNPFKSAQITGLEVIQGSADNGVIHALFFEGDGNVSVTFTSLNQISEPKWLFAMSLVTLMLSGFLKRRSRKTVHAGQANSRVLYCE